MSNKYQNLGAFLHSLPTNNPELAPLLLYINRQGVFEKFKNLKGEVTFLIPSKQMMDQLDKLYKSKQFVKLDSLVLSLLVNNKITNANDWRSGIQTMSGITFVPSKVDKKSVQLGNVTAQLSSTFSGPVSFWQLEGETIPEGKFIKKTKTHMPIQGSFENKENNMVKFEKMMNICKSKLKESQGFKTLVCELFYTLDDDQKEIALCFINGNPYAEFFLLIDSPFIKIDPDVFAENTCNASYDDILRTKGKYLCSKGDKEEFEKLKEAIEDTNFMENNYEQFYRSVAENAGKFTIDDKEYEICHPALAEYLYTIEMFCFCMKKLGEKYETAENKQEILEQMIDVNLLTNTKSTENVIFEPSENPICKFEEFEHRFKSFGLCLCKNIEISGGGQSKKIKLKNRKVQKIKRKISKLTEAQKKKLLK